MYTGKEAGAPAERRQGKKVVLQMTEGLTDVTVTCDNFFSLYSLAEVLFQSKMAMVVTIKRNKLELPPELMRMRGVKNPMRGGSILRNWG